VLQRPAWNAIINSCGAVGQVFAESGARGREGSGANLKGSASGGNGLNDRSDLGAGTLQGSAFRPRNYCPVRAVVLVKEVGTLPRRLRIRSSEYLNNVVEQDHRRIKQRIRPMLGFKRFEPAAVTIRGIELAEKIKKNQLNLRLLTKKPVTVRALWAEVLAA
jgi:hypothetical protein